MVFITGEQDGLKGYKEIVIENSDDSPVVSTNSSTNPSSKRRNSVIRNLDLEAPDGANSFIETEDDPMSKKKSDLLSIEPHQLKSLKLLTEIPIEKQAYSSIHQVLNGNFLSTMLFVKALITPLKKAGAKFIKDDEDFNLNCVPPEELQILTKISVVHAELKQIEDMELKEDDTAQATVTVVEYEAKYDESPVKKKDLGRRDTNVSEPHPEPSEISKSTTAENTASSATSSATEYMNMSSNSETELLPKLPSKEADMQVNLDIDLKGTKQTSCIKLIPIKPEANLRSPEGGESDLDRIKRMQNDSDSDGEVTPAPAGPTMFQLSPAKSPVKNKKKAAKKTDEAKQVAPPPSLPKSDEKKKLSSAKSTPPPTLYRTPANIRLIFSHSKVLFCSAFRTMSQELSLYGNFIWKNFVPYKCQPSLIKTGLIINTVVTHSWNTVDRYAYTPGCKRLETSMDFISDKYITLSNQWDSSAAGRLQVNLSQSLSSSFNLYSLKLYRASQKLQKKILLVTLYRQLRLLQWWRRAFPPLPPAAHIVYLSSPFGRFSAPCRGIESACRFGMNGFLTSLASELYTDSKSLKRYRDSLRGASNNPNASKLLKSTNAPSNVHISMVYSGLRNTSLSLSLSNPSGLSTDTVVETMLASAYYREFETEVFEDCLATKLKSFMCRISSGWHRWWIRSGNGEWD